MTNFLDNIIALTFHYNEGALFSLTDCVTGSYNPLFTIEKYGITGLERISISPVQFGIIKSADSKSSFRGKYFGFHLETIVTLFHARSFHFAKSYKKRSVSHLSSRGDGNHVAQRNCSGAKAWKQFGPFMRVSCYRKMKPSIWFYWFQIVRVVGFVLAYNHAAAIVVSAAYTSRLIRGIPITRTERAIKI